MLKLEICKKCWKECKYDRIKFAKSGKVKVLIEFSAEREKIWKKHKKCWCPYNPNTPIEKIPDNCKYKLEHLLSE